MNAEGFKRPGLSTWASGALTASNGGEPKAIPIRWPPTAVSSRGSGMLRLSAMAPAKRLT